MSPATAIAAGAAGDTVRRAGRLLLGALLVACARPPGAVGVLIPESGPLAGCGAAVLDGVRLAWGELPAEGRPTLLVEDDGGTALTAALAFQSLVEAGATVVIGPLTTDAALAVGPVAHSLRVPMLTPTATGYEVTRDNAFALRFCASDDEVAARLAAHARYELQLSHLALVVELSSRYSLGLAAAFGREFQVRGGRIVGEVGYYPEDADLGRVLDEVAALEAEGALVAGCHDEVVAMLEGAADPRVAALVLLGSDGWEGPKLAELTRGRLAGAYAASAFSPEEPGAPREAFLAAWARTHGGLPPDGAALGYDTARAVFQLFDPAEDGAAMCRRLVGLAHFEGVTGTVQMDAGGNPRGKAVVLEQLHDSSRPAFVQRLDG